MATKLFMICHQFYQSTRSNPRWLLGRFQRSLWIGICVGCFLFVCHRLWTNPKNHNFYYEVRWRNKVHRIVREGAPHFPYSHRTGVSFLINNKTICKSKDVFILIPVHSAITNFDRRRLMRRSSQGRYVREARNRALMLFFVSFPRDTSMSEVKKLQLMLQKESEKYGDIIQMNLEETYMNVVKKAIVVLYWITKYCSNAKLILKTDDDILANVETAVNATMIASQLHADFILGNRRTGRRPHRKRESKYFIPEDVYPNKTWPTYAQGGFMAYPISTAALLYAEAIKTETIWLEDVFISGICAHRAGVPIIQDNQFHFYHRRPRT